MSDRNDPLSDSRKLRFAVVDDVWEHFDLNDTENADWFITNIEEPLLALICQYEGHVVIDDMCMKSEHRVCAVCNKGMPNEPVTG